MRYLKIDLSLLKKLVSEVESELTVAEAHVESNPDSTEVPVDFVVSLSKLSGLLTSTAQESTMLVADVQRLIRVNSAPSFPAPKGLNSLEALLHKLKNEDPTDPDNGNFN